MLTCHWCGVIGHGPGWEFIFDNNVTLCPNCTQDAEFSPNTATSLTKATQKVEEEMTALPAKKGFKFGCDPELFVKDPDGRYVPADMIPGTKQAPYPVECGAVQRDGMAAEFNIDPAEDFETFHHNIKTVMAKMKNFLPKGYTFDIVPAVVFDPDIFDQATDDAKELGCTPDWNAWTGELNPPPNDPDNPYLRTASGHLHIGWTDGAQMDDIQHILNCNDLVKQLDWYLGGWSARHDSDPARRRLYGRAGACRYKPYGVEYRVLSNFWLTSRARQMEVWNRMQVAISDMSNRFMPDKYAGYCQNLISAINDTRVDPLLEANFSYPLQGISGRGDSFTKKYAIAIGDTPGF